MSIKIGIEINGLTDLKTLTPIIYGFMSRNVPYVLYLNLMSRGDKNYNIPHKKSIDKRIVNNAHKIRTFNKYSQLPGLLKQDGVKKLLALEAALTFKEEVVKIHKQGVKIYSLLYLTDSMWGHFKPYRDHIFKIYYPTKHIMDLTSQIYKFNINPNKDILLGSPLFDPLGKSGDHIIVLMPNVRAAEVSSVFRGEKQFVDIIRKITDGRKNVILKTRRKQWIPNAIKKSGIKIVGDRNKYPSVVSDLLNTSYCVVMFHSSGICEAVIGNNYIVNIKLPVARWRWGKKRLTNYFESELYNFSGVVESFTQQQILDPSWSFKPRIVAPERRDRWMEKFIGDISDDSAKMVVEDMLKD